MSNRALGKHWYNNGVTERYAEECPEGWTKGRLKKIGEAASKRMKEHNPMHNLTEEQKALHSQHLHKYNLHKTEEQIRHKADAISAAKKGKYKGRTPWNKGRKGVQEAWNKGLSFGEEYSQHVAQSLANMSEEAKRLKVQHLSESLRGRKPWNKGIHTGSWTATRRNEVLNKQYETKKQKGSFNTSQPEERYYQYLLSLYTKDDVVRQYRDNRYPFNCDFYIKSEDKFIELNLSWTHGGHPFNALSEEDVTLLEYWRQKAETSEYYKNAIYTWTDLDVRKQKIARENGLNYEVIYKYE